MADLSTISTADLLRLQDELRAREQPQPQPAQSALPADLSGMSTDDLVKMRDAAKAAQPGFWETLGRGGMQGATLGAGDEMYAAGAGVMAKARGDEFGPAYERQLQETQRANAAAKEAHPWVYTAGEVLGTIPTMLVGGALPGGARALGLTGGSLVGRSAAAGLSGSAIGAAQGFAGTDGDNEARVAGMKNGAIYGGALGAAGPALGQAVGGVARGVMGAASPSVPGVSKPAATMLAEDVVNSGGAGAIRQRMAELGPDAVLADASPSMMGRAQGLATLPDTREIINAPLIARNGGTNARLAADVEGALGPAPIPSRVEAGLAQNRQAVGDAYSEVFRNARAVDTRDLANTLDTMAIDLRGDPGRAVQRARAMLDIPGNPGQLDPSPRALFNTRQALDGLMESEKDSKVLSQLGFARQAVDDYLARAVPGIKDVDARFAELMRQSRGLQSGGQVLDTGKTAMRPGEMTEAVTAGANPQGRLVGPSGETFQMRQGLRADIDRRVGTQSNDLEALRKSLLGEGDWNQPKMAALYGDEPVARVASAVDRERAFRDTFNKTVENSQTEMRKGAADAVRPRGDKPSAADIGTVVAGATGGVQGTAMALGMRGLRAGNDIVMKAADVDRNKELAKLLTSSLSPEMDTLLEALARRAAGDKRAISVGRKAETLAQLLTQSQGGVVQDNVPQRWRIAN